MMQLESTGAWFETWFNSPYYHLLYDHRDEQEATIFLQHLCDKLTLPTKSHVLDLACGSGRHARALHELGYVVSGADLSVNSIAQASEKPEEGLDFFVHDMRNPLPEKYDAVFNLFTSFGYFDELHENALVLKSVFDSLNNGGQLVIDFLNAEVIVRELLPRQEIRKCNVLFNINRTVSNGRIVKTIAFEAEGKSYYFQEKVQALRYSDFLDLIEKAGFLLTETFGDYNLSPFEEMTSERLILICTKP